MSNYAEQPIIAKKLPSPAPEENYKSPQVTDLSAFLANTKENLPKLQLADQKESLDKLKKVLKEIAAVKNGVYQNIECCDDDEEINCCYDEIKKVLQKILPENYELEEKEDVTGLTWRGSSPMELLAFLTNKNNALQLSSSHPNVATRWQSSIGYTGNSSRKTVDIEQLPFNMAIGFRDDGLKIDAPKIAYTEDAQHYRKVFGAISPSAVKAIAIRLHAKKPGEPLPPALFNLKMN